MLSDEQIVTIRDRHLPNQGERFDCLAYARATESAIRAEYGNVAPEKWKALYRDGCELLASMGMHGKLVIDAACVEEFKASTYAIDGGIYNAKLAK